MFWSKYLSLEVLPFLQFLYYAACSVFIRWKSSSRESVMDSWPTESCIQPSEVCCLFQNTVSQPTHWGFPHQLWKEGGFQLVALCYNSPPDLWASRPWFFPGTSVSSSCRSGQQSSEMSTPSLLFNSTLGYSVGKSQHTCKYPWESKIYSFSRESVISVMH